MLGSPSVWQNGHIFTSPGQSSAPSWPPLSLLNGSVSPLASVEGSPVWW